MKTAVWSRVTSEIARRTGESYKDSKRIYDKLKTTSGRAPSLRMVARADLSLPPPPKPPRRQRETSEARGARILRESLEAAQKRAIEKRRESIKAERADRATRPPARQKPAPAPPPPPPPATATLPRVQLAPTIKPRERGAPVAVKERQRKPRNRFERLLSERGLPLGITKHLIARDLSAQWRDVEGQTKVANLMGRAFGQISRQGFVSPKTKDKLADALQAMLPNWNLGAIMQRIVGAMYAKGGK